MTTPNGTWHDHGNEGKAEMIWLDGLDVPLIQSLEVNFFELYPESKQPVTHPDDLSLRLYGARQPEADLGAARRAGTRRCSTTSSRKPTRR